MVIRKKVVRKVIAAGSAYIDPLTCDSTVSYKIIKSKRVWGSVTLTDCNKSINWYFKGTSLEKIDNAIAKLTEFRQKLVEAIPKKRVIRKKV